MKRVYYGIILFILLFMIIPVKSANKVTNIFDYSNSKEICNAVMGVNPRMTINVYNGYENTNSTSKKAHRIPSNTNDCSSDVYYNKYKDEIINGKPYVSFSRGPKDKTVKIDDVVVKKIGTYGDDNNGKYSYFSISNKGWSKDKDPSETATLRPSEYFFIKVDLSGKGLKTNSYNDLRLKIRYGYNDGDKDVIISKYNSISYYIYTMDNNGKSKTYGPFMFSEEKYVNKYGFYNAKDIKTENIVVNDLISGNLVNKEIVPSGLEITGIKIVPYENYMVRRGYFRLYSLSLDGYSGTYSNNKKYVSITGTYSGNKTIDIKTRENIVNNLLENASIKWDIKKWNTDSGSKNELYFICGICNQHKAIKNPNITYYGMPYVNSIDSTISSFISQTEQNEKSSKKAYFSYAFPSTYLENVTATNTSKTKFTTKTKLNSKLYIYEPNTSMDRVKEGEKLTVRQKDLMNNPYIDNIGYYYGVDCSSSLFAPIAYEIPYKHILGTNTYFTSNQSYILGGLKASYSDVEKYARSKDTDGKLRKAQMDNNMMKSYASKYIRARYSAQTIYDAYAKTIPGDIIDRVGHARLVTGYPYITCNDGTIIDSISKTKYSSSNNCSKHRGINGSKSYVITSEIGDKILDKQYDCSNKKSCTAKAPKAGSKTDEEFDTTLGTSIKAAYSGWDYKFNSEITDIKTLDEYFAKGRNTSFLINKKYTFEELTKDDHGAMYLPFRLKELDRIKNKKEIEIPNVQVVYDKKYSNDDLYAYVKDKKRLKGTIFTNYMIDTIKIEVTNDNVRSKPYLINPNQTNIFSLYDDIKDYSFLKNLNYDGNLSIKISIKFGPNNSTVRKAANADANGFVEVIIITHKKGSNITTSTPKSTVIPKNTSTPKPANSHSPTVTFIRGDINGNGIIEVIDYISLSKYFIKTKKLTNDELKRADANNDGKVNPADFNTIIRILINLEKPTIVENK